MKKNKQKKQKNELNKLIINLNQIRTWILK